MARDGMFFKKIAECHPKFLTPHVAIVAITLWSIVLTLTGTFKQLFTYVIFGEWIFFGMTVVAVIVLRKKKPDLAAALQDLGLPGDADPLRPGRRLCRRRIAAQLLQERHVRAAHHLPGHPGLSLLEGKARQGGQARGLKRAGGGPFGRTE